MAASHFDRVVAAWKVATIGPFAIMQTSSATDGGAGSCTWTTSKWPVAQPATHPRGRHRPELEAGHRAVVRDRHGPAGEGIHSSGSDSSCSAGVSTSTW